MIGYNCKWPDKNAKNDSENNSTNVTNDTNDTNVTNVILETNNSIQTATNIILSTERFKPQVGFIFPSIKIGGINRKCKAEFFEDHDWLHYDVSSKPRSLKNEVFRVCSRN